MSRKQKPVADETGIWKRGFVKQELRRIADSHYVAASHVEKMLASALLTLLIRSEKKSSP